MLSLVLNAAGTALVVCGLAGMFTHRLAYYKVNGVMCLGNICNLLGNVLSENTVSASIVAAAAALTGWLWWKGGGGDDTKRRLRSLVRRFQGVRRTAPSPS